MLDKVKFAVALLLIAAGIAGFYYFGQQALIARVGMVLAGVVLGVAVAWFTVPGQQFLAFARESINETKKVVWPSRKEALQTTGIVFVFVLVMAIFLWVTDKSLEWVLYDLVLGWRK